MGQMMKGLNLEGSQLPARVLRRHAAFEVRFEQNRRIKQSRDKDKEGEHSLLIVPLYSKLQFYHKYNFDYPLIVIEIRSMNSEMYQSPKIKTRVLKFFHYHFGMQ